MLRCVGRGLSEGGSPEGSRHVGRRDATGVRWSAESGVPRGPAMDISGAVTRRKWMEASRAYSCPPSEHAKVLHNKARAASTHASDRNMPRSGSGWDTSSLLSGSPIPRPAASAHHGSSSSRQAVSHIPRVSHPPTAPVRGELPSPPGVAPFRSPLGHEAVLALRSPT